MVSRGCVVSLEKPPGLSYFLQSSQGVRHSVFSMIMQLQSALSVGTDVITCDPVLSSGRSLPAELINRPAYCADAIVPHSSSFWQASWELVCTIDICTISICSIGEKKKIIHPEWPKCNIKQTASIENILSVGCPEVNWMDNGELPQMEVLCSEAHGFFPPSHQESIVQPHLYLNPHIV